MNILTRVFLHKKFPYKTISKLFIRVMLQQARHNSHTKERIWCEVRRRWWFCLRSPWMNELVHICLTIIQGKTLLICTPNAVPIVASFLKPKFILWPKNLERKLPIIAAKVTPKQCRLPQILFEFPAVFLFQRKNMLS